MNRVEAALRSAVADLQSAGRRAALVGGLAVSARTEPRFTRDVDLAVAVPDDRAAEGVAASLGAKGYRILAIVEQEAAKRLATIRLEPPGEDAGGVVVDLLVASSGVEPDVVARAEELEVFPGFTVPVATVADLLALKVLSRDDRRRPQDAADLRALLAVAGERDRAAARAVLLEIARRGFHRGRDLERALGNAIADLGT